jgi:hypothetical protein
MEIRGFRRFGGVRGCVLVRLGSSFVFCVLKSVLWEVESYRPRVFAGTSKVRVRDILVTEGALGGSVQGKRSLKAHYYRHHQCIYFPFEEKPGTSNSLRAKLQMTEG